MHKHRSIRAHDDGMCRHAEVRLERGWRSARITDSDAQRLFAAVRDQSVGNDVERHGRPIRQSRRLLARRITDEPCVVGILD
jgi:hypothetical protein